MYVPLDSGYPQERLQFMVEDAHASVVLVRSELLQHWQHSSARMICVEDEWEQLAREDDANPEAGAGFENLAYVIYTSGSTGKPKGVGVRIAAWPILCIGIFVNIKWTVTTA